MNLADVKKWREAENNTQALKSSSSRKNAATYTAIGDTTTTEIKYRSFASENVGYLHVNTFNIGSNPGQTQLQTSSKPIRTKDGTSSLLMCGIIEEASSI